MAIDFFDVRFVGESLKNLDAVSDNISTILKLLPQPSEFPSRMLTLQILCEIGRKVLEAAAKGNDEVSIGQETIVISDWLGAVLEEAKKM